MRTAADDEDEAASADKDNEAEKEGESGSSSSESGEEENNSDPEKSDEASDEDDDDDEADEEAVVQADHEFNLKVRLVSRFFVLLRDVSSIKLIAISSLSLPLSLSRKYRRTKTREWSQAMKRRQPLAARN